MDKKIEEKKVKMDIKITDKVDIKIKDGKAFLATLLQKYFERGFGVLSKREIDVLMIHLLLENSEWGEKPNHELSILFKITETKIKNLRHEAKLRFVEDSDKYIKNHFFELLEKVKFETDKNNILFIIEDKYLQKGIQGRLKELGYFADISFNDEIVRISEDGFSALLESYFEEDDRKKFEDQINAALPDEDKIEFKGLLKMFLEEAATTAGGKIVDIGALYLTGGLSEIGGLIGAIKKVLVKE